MSEDQTENKFTCFYRKYWDDYFVIFVSSMLLAVGVSLIAGYWLNGLFPEKYRFDLAAISNGFQMVFAYVLPVGMTLLEKINPQWVNRVKGVIGYDTKKDKNT